MRMWRQRFVEYMHMRQWSPWYGRKLRARSGALPGLSGSRPGAGGGRHFRGGAGSLPQTGSSPWKSKDARLTARTQAARLGAVKAFVRFLARYQYLPADWSWEIDLPRLPQPLPRTLLSVNEVLLLMEVPDISTVLGLRDRAMMELLYSSAIRNSELRALEVGDVSFERHEAYVRKGKGNKARVVPLGQEAARWLLQWMPGRSAALAPDAADKRVFFTWRGRPMTAGERVRRGDPNQSDRWPGQTRHAASLAALLCDAHDGQRRRDPPPPGAARARLSGQHPALHPS